MPLVQYQSRGTGLRVASRPRHLTTAKTMVRAPRRRALTRVNDFIDVLIAKENGVLTRDADGRIMRLQHADVDDRAVIAGGRTVANIAVYAALVEGTSFSGCRRAEIVHLPVKGAAFLLSPAGVRPAPVRVMFCGRWCAGPS